MSDIQLLQMSVLQCGGFLSIFMCQLCGSIICLYFNCGYTQPVWDSEQISNTNQFIQHAQRMCGCAVPTYPLRVYSGNLMIRMARGQRNGDRSHPLVVMHHNNPQESETTLCQDACKCL